MPEKIVDKYLEEIISNMVDSVNTTKKNIYNKYHCSDEVDISAITGKPKKITNEGIDKSFVSEFKSKINECSYESIVDLVVGKTVHDIDESSIHPIKVVIENKPPTCAIL